MPLGGMEIGVLSLIIYQYCFRIMIISKSKFLQKDESVTYKLHPLFKEIYENAQILPQRRSYSKSLKLFCLLIHNYSAKAYDYLRQVIPLPSDSNLRKSFSNDMLLQCLSFLTF